LAVHPVAVDIVAKSKQAKTERSNSGQTWRNNHRKGQKILTESSKEGYGSEMAVLPTVMMNIETWVVH
jgi:hypothetical protein